MPVEVGETVIYTLTEEDCKQINRRRTTPEAILDRIKKNTDLAGFWPLGAQAHIGEKVNTGYAFPMIVVRTRRDRNNNVVNGQVLLDGSDAFWVQNIPEGSKPGEWMYRKVSTSDLPKQIRKSLVDDI